ncbi:MAG: hypothetical protein ILP02_04200, partial [Clostridia bacterium]|nr:hypothetical protein [Clostridia bacterium]
YDINITFGVRYTDYEEVAKIAADEYSKSELKENSAWQNRIDQLRKTVERLEVENELLQVELDAYRYHLRSSDYRGTRAQWMDDVVSGRIDVSGNPYLKEKEYWDEATAPPGSTSKGSVLVIIDKNFAEKEFTVDDFKQYFTVYDVSDMSYIEKGEDGKDRFVRQCVLMIGVPFGIVPDVEEYSWNQWDSSTLFEAIRILKDLPFIKYVGPSPFGMGG